MKIDLGYTKVNSVINATRWASAEVIYYPKPWSVNPDFLLGTFTSKVFVCSKPRYGYLHSNGHHQYGVVCVIENNNKFDLGHGTLSDNPGTINDLNSFRDYSAGAAIPDGYFYSTSTKISIKRDTEEGQKILTLLNKHKIPTILITNLETYKKQKVKLENQLG